MDANIVVIAFQFLVFIFSVVIHEVSHGYVAERLGDPTARLAGRLTLNPLKHLDIFGSFVLPIILAVSNLPIIGWAKPVPYDPYNLKDPKTGGGQIAASGPVSNILVALVFGFLLRTGIAESVGGTLLPQFFAVIIYINILLAVFNLVPIPPLDGSKVLYAFLPPTRGAHELMAFLERYGLILIFFFVFWGWGLIQPIIGFLFRLIAGETF